MLLVAARELAIMVMFFVIELTKNSLLNIIELLSSSLPDSFSVLTVGDDFISSLNKVQWWMMFVYLWKRVNQKPSIRYYRNTFSCGSRFSKHCQSTSSPYGYILCNWINQKFYTRYYRATLKEFLIWFYSDSVELTKNSLLNIIELLLWIPHPHDYVLVIESIKDSLPDIIGILL